MTPWFADGGRSLAEIALGLLAVGLLLIGLAWIREIGDEDV